MPQALITGANRGIGLGHTSHLLQRGWTVHAAVRNPDAALALKGLPPGDGTLKLYQYDAADPDSAHRLADQITAPIDILFANAGVMHPKDQSFGKSGTAALLDAMAVNVMGPLALAEAFADQVARSQMKVIALQSSKLGSISANDSGGFYAYRASKAALNAVGKSLSIDLKDREIVVLVLHPGWVRTDMGGPNALLTVEESVEAQLDLIARANPKMNGRFYHVSGEDIRW